MTRLFDVAGQERELLLALQNAGLTPGQANLVSQDPGEARRWVAQLRDPNGVLIAEIPREDAPSKFIYWTPVYQYADKLRRWNDRFKLGLTDDQIDGLVLPDHAGSLQPTGISCTLGKGLQGDRGVIQQIIEYELDLLGIPYEDDSLEERQLSYYPGSEPAQSSTPQLAAALLDIGRFWDRENGVNAYQVREQLRGRPLPGLQVDWLVALNPQILELGEHETIPGLIAPGLAVHEDGDNSEWGEVTVFDRYLSKAYVECIGGSPDDSREYLRSVVVFRE